MKIKELIKKLLGYKTEYGSAISSLNDCIPILSREIFDGDAEKLRYLEDIKKEYSEILFKKRSVLSMDLNTNNLYEKMNMYIEMLQDLLESEEVDNSFEKAFYYNAGTKKINIMIKMNKLKLYYYNIEQLVIEANVRRMALKEIFDEKLFLSSKKKNSIKEEMNHLAGSLIIYTNQIQAIKLQIDSYLMNYEILGKEEFVEEEIETELLDKKQEELEYMIAEFIPENREFINKSNNRFLNIAYMEEALSKYIYKHKKEEVEKFLKKIYLLKISNPKETLFQIERMEMKAKVLTLYGRNLIKKEDMCHLYDIKFLMITDNILIKEEQYLAEKCNFVELECYGEIITDKISKLLHGDAIYLKETFSTDYSEVAQAITKVLKNKDSEFSFVDILNDKKKLGLLLAVEQKNGIENYFKTCMEPMAKYNTVNFHEHILDFEEILSLETIYSMVYYNEEKDFDSLYELYKLLKKKQERSMCFKFPEGLREINGFYNRMSFENEQKFEKELLMDQKFIKKLRDLASDYIVEFPSSLQRINGNIFSNMSFIDIIFNDGIKGISTDSFRGVKAKSISFPHSLETIDETAFFNANFLSLCFENYEQSQLTEDSLCHLIKSMFELSIIEKGSYVPSLPNNTKDKLLTCKVLPNFASLVLIQSVESDCDQIEIKYNELSMEFIKRINDFSHDKNLTDFAYKIIFDKLKEIIQSKIEKEKTLKKSWRDTIYENKRIDKKIIGI